MKMKIVLGGLKYVIACDRVTSNSSMNAIFVLFLSKLNVKE